MKLEDIRAKIARLCVRFNLCGENRGSIAVVLPKQDLGWCGDGPFYLPVRLRKQGSAGSENLFICHWHLRYRLLTGLDTFYLHQDG
jgi:hypothetical protein